MTQFLNRLARLYLMCLAALAALCFIAICTLFAQEPTTPMMQKSPLSPLHDIAPAERPVLSLLGPRNIRLRHITTSPAAINGLPSDILRATYGGNERLCINTGTGPGSTTTWSCITLGAP